MILTSFSCLTAQCVVSVRDTVRLECGDSGQIRTILAPFVVSSSTTKTLNQVWFLDPHNGFIVGDNGTFLRTTDSGRNWELSLFPPDQNWKSVYFVTQQTGYMVSDGGQIARTTDGGISWSVLFNDPAKHFTRIRFINATTGFAIGEQGLILKTTDGSSWDTVPSGTSARLNDIVFVNQVKGFIAGEYDNQTGQGVFMTTSDGGNNWVNSVVEAGCSMYNSIAFADENVGFVSGTNNTYRTTNGGTSWQPLCWSASVAIACQADSVVFLQMNRDLYRFRVTANVPEEFVHLEGSSEFRGIVCPDNQSMVAVGTYGLILLYHTPVSYQWTPSAGLSETNVASPVASPDTTTEYTVTAQLSDGSSCTASARVEVFRDWYTPDLCMVTVDSATSHNRIIWNKPAHASADSVYLYKEGSVSGQFVRLAGYSAAHSGEYVDQQSNATVRSESYALKILDKCSFLSWLGYIHKPVHLSVNQGMGSTINLIWEHYQGADVFTYNLYRKVSTGNPELIASLSGSNTQYTDMNPPAGELTYLVEAVLNASCIVRTDGASSFSNLARFSSYPHGTGDDKVTDGLRILENPVTTHFTVNESNLYDIACVSLLSLNGKPVAVWQNPTIPTFDISRLASGLYLLKIELKSIHKSFMQKLVKL